MKRASIRFFSAVLSCLAVGLSQAEPVYMHVDKDGKRVFSDKPHASSSEVKINRVSTVSGVDLGKKVEYAGGRPDSGKGSTYSRYVNGSHDERASRKAACERQRTSVMRVTGISSQAGLQEDKRSYERDCVLNAP